jgi:hypothetical protein
MSLLCGYRTAMSSLPEGPGDDDQPTDTGSPAPDAADAGPEPTGNPVDPAISTTSPDPGQTGRDRR